MTRSFFLLVNLSLSLSFPILWIILLARRNIFLQLAGLPGECYSHYLYLVTSSRSCSDRPPCERGPCPDLEIATVFAEEMGLRWGLGGNSGEQSWGGERQAWERTSNISWWGSTGHGGPWHPLHHHPTLLLLSAAAVAMSAPAWTWQGLAAF